MDVLEPALTAAIKRVKEKSPEKKIEPDAVDQSTPSMVGRFEIGDLLGEGGFGRFYQAYDPILDRSLALKDPIRRRGVIQGKSLNDVMSSKFWFALGR